MYETAFAFHQEDREGTHDFALANSIHRLEDFDNACSAYDKAIQLAGVPGEHIFHLNYGEVLELKSDSHPYM